MTSREKQDHVESESEKKETNHEKFELSDKCVQTEEHIETYHCTNARL